MLYNLQDGLSRERFKTRVAHLWENGSIVELTDKSRRTLTQNRYIHVCIGTVAAETGNDFETIKQEIFKRRVNPDIFVEEKDDPALGHISTLRSSRFISKEDMSTAIDRFRKFASELGIYLPDGSDLALIEQMEYELSRVEKYL